MLFGVYNLSGLRVLAGGKGVSFLEYPFPEENFDMDPKEEPIELVKALASQPSTSLKNLYIRLKAAIEFRNLKAVKLLISKFSFPREETLLAAVRAGSLAMVKLFLFQPINNDPIIMAIAHGLLSTLRFLFLQGVEFEQSQDQSLLISLAASKKEETLLKFLEGMPEVQEDFLKLSVYKRQALHPSSYLLKGFEERKRISKRFYRCLSTKELMCRI